MEFFDLPDLPDPDRNHHLETDLDSHRLILSEGMRIYDDNNNFYTIQQLLGEGNFSSCYLAFCEVNQRHYALKISKDDDDSRSSLINELNISKLIADNIQNPLALAHVNLIISIFPIESSNSQHFVLVSEVIGPNLLQFLNRLTPDGVPITTGLVFAHIRNISRNCLHGLSAIQSAGFYHADVKPENICIDANQLIQNSPDCAKIIDLGGCMHNSDAFPNSYMITRWYRPPEIILGYRCDEKADVWSLGVTIFEMLTGHPLIPALNQGEVLYYIQRMIKPFTDSFINNAPQRYTYFNANNELNVDSPANYYRFSQFTDFRDVVNRVITNHDEAAMLIEALEHMLEPDPHERYSFEQLANLPFFQ